MIRVQTNAPEIVADLRQIAARAGNLGGVLKALGEDLARDAKLAFATSTGPDGRRWAPNAQATYVAYLASRTGTARKDGRLSAKGAALAANKRPLIDTRALADTISYRVVGNVLEVFTPRHFGQATPAIHQFGGQAGRGKKTTIPARPFFPVTRSGDLYPRTRTQIADLLTRYLDPRRR